MSTGVHITVAEYDRMIAAGEFLPREEHQVELIRGEIREMSPINPAHQNVLNYLMYWSIDNCPRNYVRVRNQDSIDLIGLESVPQPDLIWERMRRYSQQRPSADDVLLVIEVADTSLAFDRGEKAKLYAEAGIKDYWVVNIPQQVIEVHREPKDGAYQSITTHGKEQSITPLEFPHVSLAIAKLWHPTP